MREISCYMYHQSIIMYLCVFSWGLCKICQLRTSLLLVASVSACILWFLERVMWEPMKPIRFRCLYQAISSHQGCRQMSKEPRLRKGLSRLEQFRRPVPVRIHGRRFQWSRFPFPVSLQFSTKYTLRVCFPPVRLVDPLFITGDPFRNASLQAIPICSDGHCQADADVEDRDFEGSSFGRIVTGDSRMVIIMGYHHCFLMVLGVLDGFGLEWGMSSLWKWKGKTNLAVQNWLNRLLWPWLLVVWLCGFAMLPRDSWNSPIHCITLCQSDPLTAPVSDLSVSRQRLKRSADRTPLMWAARHGHLNVAGPSGWFQLQHISKYLKQIIQWIWLGSKFTSPFQQAEQRCCFLMFYFKICKVSYVFQDFHSSWP